MYHEGNYGSGRFCNVKCARGYSTKMKRGEINNKVSSSVRRTCGTEFLTCHKCHKQLPWTHFLEMAEKFGQNETKFCSESCRSAAKEMQNRSLAFRQKMSDAAIRRLERGDVWFGTQNSIEAFGKSIRCDSLLERSFIVTMMKDSRVKDVRRSGIWIPYLDGEVNRHYNPDFIVEFYDGTFAIAEIKSERVGKNDVWEDYRQKAEIKHKLLECYASQNGMTVIWYTQMTSPQTYREVCKLSKTLI
jgi:hypothetical protein